MKAISGKDFAKLLEKKGWNCEERREVITFTPKREIRFGSLCRYTEVVR